MKKQAALILSTVAIALYACSPNTPGGPGTALPDSEKPMIGQTDDTFTLDMPMTAAKLEQGGTETVSIGIKRGTNFEQDVSLRFTDIPSGISIQPDAPMLPRTEETVALTISAAENASLGDFTVKVSGHPGAGADARAELHLTVSKREADEVAEGAGSDAVTMKREELIKAMRADLDALEVKYEELKARASVAKDDAKAMLDKKVAEAGVKLEAARASLEEAKDAAPDRWEKIKDGFSGAVDELKSMFE